MAVLVLLSQLIKGKKRMTKRLELWWNTNTKLLFSLKISGFGGTIIAHAFHVPKRALDAHQTYVVLCPTTTRSSKDILQLLLLLLWSLCPPPPSRTRLDWLLLACTIYLTSLSSHSLVSRVRDVHILQMCMWCVCVPFSVESWPIILTW